MAVADDYGDVIRWFGTCTDITRQKRNELVSDFIAATSSRLVGHFSGASTMEDVARSAVPGFADWCVIDMLTPEGGTERIALATSSLNKEELETEISRIYPPDFRMNQLLSDTLHTEVSQLIGHLSADHPLFRKANLQADRNHPSDKRWLESCLCVPLISREKMLGAITYGMADSGRHFEISDLQAAEDVALRYTMAMENRLLYQQVQDAGQRKDEFLAMLGHELRNPLAPIRSGLELLLLDSDPENRSTLVTMKDQAEHLVHLVDDLLDASRIMRGKIGLKQATVDMRDILARAIAAVRWNFREKKQTFKTNISSHSMPVYGDPVRLVQIVSNLLNNASKYTDMQGEIELKVIRHSEHLSIHVIDNGIGIEPELLTQVFDLFTQSSRALDRSQGGLGIGLTLVRDLVEMHHGTVNVHSQGPGQGSEFIVELPLSRESVTSSDSISHHENLQERNLKILVVDDNVGAAQLLTLLLAKLGAHEIEKVHDGRATLDKLKTWQPDLILLDIGLPEMDGYEVARHIRNNPALNSTLLVALTGYGREEDRQQSRAAGFDEHLVKPPALEILRNLLRDPRLLSQPE